MPPVAGGAADRRHALRDHRGRQWLVGTACRSLLRIGWGETGARARARPRPGEDTEWGQHATAQGFRVAYIPDAIVLTPSCKSFNELARRWDRHVAHEFRKVGHDFLSIARWLAGYVVVAASQLAEVIRIIRSDRITGVRDRLLALMCLTRIRLYRAQRMLALALHRDAAAVMGKWNRENS